MRILPIAFYATSSLITLCYAQDATTVGLRLPSIIGDHMMLQANQSDLIWGKAPSGAMVKIDFLDAQGRNLAHVEATTGANGKWSAKLPTLAAGTAGTLTVADGSEIKTVHDVLVGEVWLCSGQSNMVYNVADLASKHSKNSAGGEAEGEEDQGDAKTAVPGETSADSDGTQKLATAKKEAADAQGALRFFTVLRYGNQMPQDDVWGRWHVATPESVIECSAAAWNFAVQLRDKLAHPAAVIVSAVGGTAAETWISRAALENLSVYPAIKARLDKDAAKTPGSLEKLDREMTAWFKAHPVPQIEAKCINSEGMMRAMGKPLPGAPKEPSHPQLFRTPSRYYNGMIHGLVPYGIKGILWYQADGNAKFPSEYPELIKALITSWRNDWGAELPFYYVETQNMTAYQVQPVEDFPTKSHPFVATMRAECQAALDLPKTDVVTAVDLNNTPESVVNPHYANKKPLGQRLANEALEQVYGQNLGEVHSPAYASSTIEGNKIRIKLTHAEGLRAIHEDPLTGFAIRGGSGPWVWGDAKIDGTDILVSNRQMSDPTAVRYAWAANPIKNLSVENGAGLPLRPFRTDNDKLPDHLPGKEE